VTQQYDDGSRFDRLALVRFALGALLLTWLSNAMVADTLDDTTPPDDVMQADRDVASVAQDTDVREAFEQYVADDAVLFRPLPEPARDWLANHEPANGRLDWAPDGALVACDRALAITIGNDNEDKRARRLRAGVGRFRAEPAQLRSREPPFRARYRYRVYQGLPSFPGPLAASGTATRIPHDTTVRVEPAADVEGPISSAAHIARRSSSVRRSMRSRRTRARARIAENRAATGRDFRSARDSKPRKKCGPPRPQPWPSANA
jgi:hypothetical protein